MSGAGDELEGDPRAEARRLAGAFARHLEHLRDFRGVAYVAAGPLAAAGTGDAEVGEAAAGETTASSGEAPLPQTETQAQTPTPTPTWAPTQTQAGSERGASRERTADRRAAEAVAGANRPDSTGAGEPDGAAARPVRPSSVANPPPQQSSQLLPLITSDQPAPAGGQAAQQGDPAMRARAREWSAAEKLSYLRERNVGDCQRCVLARTRRNIVFGVGSPEADLMFVGEAPGAEEDRRGEPFVGAAGQRLDQWIAALGLSRSEVYIANVLKCRPPGNRDPQAVEIERCSPFLQAQIRAIQPRVIVALGRFAGCLLLGRQRKMYEMRRDLHHYLEPKSGARIPLVVTYHPSYVLRSEKQPRGGRTRGKSDPGGAIKSEEQKVLRDLERATTVLNEGRPSS